MKPFPILALFLFFASTLFAGGPWSEYGETQPEATSPAAVVIEYVLRAHQRDIAACRKMMTKEYEAWLERVGGVETSLEEFIEADLEKRFAWRQLIEGTSAIVWVRVYLPSRGRETNVALNLTQTESGWKLAI